MVDISRKTYEKIDIETTVDNDGLLWLIEEHIEEGLNHKNLREITIKHHPDHKSHRYGLVEKSKKQVNIIFMDGKLGIEAIMDYKTILTHKFRTRLGFRQYDLILTNEQSLITKINEFIWRRKYANTI